MPKHEGNPIVPASQDEANASLSDMVKAVHERLLQTRQAMMVGTPSMRFFSHLLMRLEPIPTFSLPTAGTDGKSLYYNPSFVDGLKAGELIFLLAHEVMHPGLGHHVRIQLREHDKFNIAADGAINPLLVECGLEMPKIGGVMPGDKHLPKVPRDAQWSAETLYEHLDEAAVEKTRQQGACSGMGGILAPEGEMSTIEAATEASKWEVAVVAAAREAYRKGDMPDGISRVVDGLVNPKVRWEDELREFIIDLARDDYSWIHPSRRHFVMTDGEILPGAYSERLGHLLWLVDTSGSITREQMTEFASQVVAALDLNPMRLSVWFHTTEVYHRIEWRPGDGPIRFDKIHSGGTSHVDAFQKIEQLDEQPVAIIALTDLASSFPSREPMTPTLWAHKKCDEGLDIPWGRRVIID